MTDQTPAPDAGATDAKVTGTTGAPNPKAGSSDAARGLGGHSKDADHAPGAPAGYVEDGKPAAKE